MKRLKKLFVKRHRFIFFLKSGQQFWFTAEDVTITRDTRTSECIAYEIKNMGRPAFPMFVNVGQIEAVVKVF